MLRTHVQPCSLDRAEADALNHASGQIYSQVLVTHWRALRHSHHWLSQGAAEKLNDWYHRDAERLLHAHSIDAAQQGFYKACKTSRASRDAGLSVRYPYKRKWYRTTIWKSTGIQQKQDHLLLARARGLEPIRVAFEQTTGRVREARLVFDLNQRGYFWHFVVEDGLQPALLQTGVVAAVDLGEVHPVAITDGEEVAIVACREIRSINRQTNKELGRIAAKLSRCQKNGRRARRLKLARKKLLARQKRRRRDLEHKVTKATIDWCKQKQVGILVIGDVRDVADKTRQRGRLNRKSRQKVSNWSHGTVRKYLIYKAEQAGIAVYDKQPEHYTSQTCLRCAGRHKPKGRNYLCPRCGYRFARDAVGCANILSGYLYHELALVEPKHVTYRRPFSRWNSGLRSPADSRHVACASEAAIVGAA